MAVLVEALSIILRRDAIARRYNGGWPRFVSDAPNSTLCADSEIVRLGFMHPADVSAFIKSLEGQGFVFLSQAGEAIDIVVVDQREGPTTPCKWIEFFHREIRGGSVAAARLVRSQDKTLASPRGWSFEHSLSKSFQFHPGTQLDNDDYEFIRHDFGTDVLRDRRTGKEVFITRPTELSTIDQDSPLAVDEIRKQHNLLYSQAVELIEPYLDPTIRPSNAEDVARISRACELLERVIALVPANWNAWGVLGMARRLLQDREGAYAAFKRAYGLHPNETEMGRNLVAECLNLGYAQEAIEVSEEVVRLNPLNAGLIANHSLALLIGGDVNGATREIESALMLDPNDGIAKSIRSFVSEVQAGRVPAPSRLET